MDRCQKNDIEMLDDELSFDSESLTDKQPHFKVINTIAEVHSSNDIEMTDLNRSSSSTDACTNAKIAEVRLLEQNKGIASLCLNADDQTENLIEIDSHVAIEMIAHAETEKKDVCAESSTKISAVKPIEYLNTLEERIEDATKPLIKSINATHQTKPLPCNLDVVKNEKISKRLRILAQLGIQALAIIWFLFLIILPIVSIITFVSEFGFGEYLLYSLFYLLVYILTTRTLIQMFKTKSMPKGDDLVVLLFGTAIAFIIMFVVYTNGDNRIKDIKFSPGD